jgi:hypothetical protein
MGKFWVRLVHVNMHVNEGECREYGASASASLASTPPLRELPD